MTFGEYLKQKRLDKEITLRGFAKLVDISPVYLCDLEKGRKAAPSMEVMQKMVSKLALNKEESERFYDLAALEQTAKNPIPKDLNAFLKDNRVIVSALRRIWTLRTKNGRILLISLEKAGRENHERNVLQTKRS